jgi:hypothetical protein
MFYFVFGFLVAGEELCMWGEGLREMGWRWCGINSLEYEVTWEHGRKKFGAAATLSLARSTSLI